MGVRAGGQASTYMRVNSSYMMYLWTMISEMWWCKERSCGVACEGRWILPRRRVLIPNADACRIRGDEAAFLGFHSTCEEEILPSWVSILYLEIVHVDSVATLRFMLLVMHWSLYRTNNQDAEYPVSCR